MAEVLVLAGPAGVGKSTVAYEIGHRLQARSIGHALVDTDELDRIYPVPADVARITEHHLRVMWHTYAERGIDRLIVVGVYLDRPKETVWLERAIPGAQLTRIRLLASGATLSTRVRGREIGSDHDGQLERTRRQLAASLEPEPGVTLLTTDGASVPELADRIIGLWMHPTGATVP